jgi:signal transduction histidine kinase
VLLFFFLALALPTGLLVYQAYSQLKWEAFHQYRVMAEELSGRIDGRLGELVAAEEARSFADYSFLVIAGDPSANFLQRSPLSAFPVERSVPGILAYFQVDAGGSFSTPLLPPPGASREAYGISAAELSRRLALQNRVRDILSSNRLVSAGTPPPDSGRAVAGAPMAFAQEEAKETAAQEQAGMRQDALADRDAPAQAAFDALNAPADSKKREVRKQDMSGAYERVEDLQLDSRLASQSREQAERERPRPAAAEATYPARAKRKEVTSVPEPLLRKIEAAPEEKDAFADLRISTFESEIDPFDFALLDSGHFVLYRKVWRDEQRYIQGALIDQQDFIRGLVSGAFRETALAGMSDLAVAFAGNVVAFLPGREERGYIESSRELGGALLYRTRLSDPLADMELVYSITRLPAGPGATVLGWICIVILLVLCGGFYFIYRLGMSQIALARQQQDFVSAVSHELKTPLTSIRMYGEMLRAGWADEDKKQAYYDFIYDESERLSRLIANVLQLARLSRSEPQFDLKPIRVAELMDTMASKISSQVESAGFSLHSDCAGDTRELSVLVDADSFTQVMINLVDNALKFSADAQQRRLDIAARAQTDGSVLFTVRDYGPGIPPGQLKKIFTLFYRSENELTRETVGTGIGLALVQQLVSGMNGTVDVRNLQPGAEFRVSFPCAA